MLRQAVRGISDVLTVPGEINLDFNDVKKVMGGGGHALMALGHGSGDNRALDAVEEAIHSPLLEDSIHGATRVLYNVTSSGDLGMLELSQVADFVREKVHPNAEIIMGTVIDEDLDGDIQMTLIATGFDQQQAAAVPAAPAAAGDAVFVRRTCSSAGASDAAGHPGEPDLQPSRNHAVRRNSPLRPSCTTGKPPVRRTAATATAIGAGIRTPPSDANED